MMTRAIGTAWAIACAVLLVITIAVGVGGAIQTSHYHKELRQDTIQTHFYRVIAGQDAAGIHVNDILATDIRNTPKNRLPLFQGTSNQYGGISAEIGVDPFDNSCGVECGHLTSSVLRNVEDSRAGNPPTIRATKHTTSFVFPFIILLFVFIGGLAAAALPSLARARKKQKAQGELRRELRNAYPEECRVLDRLSNEMASYKSHTSSQGDMRKYLELARMHDGIENGLRLRLDPEVANNEISDARTEKLMREAQDTLKSIEAGNEMGQL